ncbi:S53 family peptidase [bacterium]|nr:S53 family peptidase [bacterium]
MSGDDSRSLRKVRKLALLLLGLQPSFGCGGDSGSTPAFQSNSVSVADSAASLKSETAESASATLVFENQDATLSSQIIAEPTYHLAPVFPPPPIPVDAPGGSQSANLAPQVSLIPESLQTEPTLRLKVDELEASAQADTLPSAVAPQTAVTYSPAQIRAAYGLPPVPASLTGLSAAQAAQFGAGQTIYIVDAYHDLYAYSELTAFSQLFGLPACTNSTLAPTASLPLPSSTGNGATFYQVYATSSGGMTSTPPAYDANWAVESALDVQWAHAIAPLARIVLIEAPDASMAGMTGAIQLANRMGPGVVSMSFGANEASYVTSLDSYFKTTGMSYYAATGDNGAGLSWPAVSPNVVAVGGTSLSFAGSGSRSETVWSGTGGGVSAYQSRPGYQASTVPGMGSATRRSVADVAFNANPATGQYVAVIRNQTTPASYLPVSWVTAGGTSLSTPQWAALMAVANAMRAQAGKPALGDPHNPLYADLGSNSANYAASFLDVTQGNNGAGAANAAKAGYDTPTGLGTPNGLNFLNRLTGVSATPAPPACDRGQRQWPGGKPADLYDGSVQFQSLHLEPLRSSRRDDGEWERGGQLAEPRLGNLLGDLGRPG